MTCWGDLVTQPKPSELEIAQQISQIKYTAPLHPHSSTSPASERTVITSESRGLILSGGTTGFRTWEAALHLGSLLATPEGEALVRGQRVLELGAGTGFLSLFCVRHLGVKGVVATDRELALIDNMRECVRLNQLQNQGSAVPGQDGLESESIPMYPAVWEWGTPLEKTEKLSAFVEGDGLRFDVALGADLVRPFLCHF